MALRAFGTTMPLTPGIIQPSNVPIVPQTMPSAFGSTEGVSTMPLVTSTSEQHLQSFAQPQTAMTHTALTCLALPYTAMLTPAMQFTAMLSTVTPSIMTARPDQLGLFGAPSF